MARVIMSYAHKVSDKNRIHEAITEALNSKSFLDRAMQKALSIPRGYLKECEHTSTALNYERARWITSLAFDSGISTRKILYALERTYNILGLP